ncbi:MAG: hypothetical protein GTO24_23760, partial [candidate division Zixibacteria bacterium]|nr:hypothetical protein [candidate division Zixibacteria bacterium]
QIARRFEAFIVYEKNNPPKILRDDDWATLPDSFRQDYKRLFPSVYRRLSARLNDRSRLSDALVEVFTDFIERFRKEYDQLGEQRFAYLQETCDRTISSLNQEDPTTSPLVEAPPIKLSDRINDEEERAQIDNIAAEIR